MGDAPSTPPLTVVVVTPKAIMGGAERWLLSVLGNSPRLTATVIVLQDGPFVEALSSNGHDVVVLPTGAKGRDIAIAAARIRRELHRLDPDVMLANGIKAAAVALGPARLLGIPSVWVRHEESFGDTLGRAALRLADRTIVVAPAPERDRRFGPVFIPPPLLDEPLPVDEARKALSALGVPEDGLLRVGMFSRLARYKGIDSMISALAEPGGRGWRLVVAGITDPGQTGGELAHLMSLADSLGVSERVSWLGQVESAGRMATGLDAIAVMTRSGVPGYPPGEGFGMTVVEAFAAGVPVLGDLSTVPALGLAGYSAGAILVSSGDPATAGRGLGELADPQSRSRLAAAAAAAGARHPRAKRVAFEVCDVLAEACHRPGVAHVDGPPITVVSTVWNEGSGIDTLLRALAAQVRPGDEVIVVDGGSTDDTVPRLRTWAAGGHPIRIIESPGAGISAGRNIGIEAAATEWVACTDAGCRPDPTWLEALRAGAASGGIDLVTGVYRAGHGSGRAWELALAAVGYPVPEELRRATPLVRVYGRLFGRSFDASLPTGRSVAFTRGAWRAAGGFPEDLATAEDVLFGKRAVAAGARAVLAVDAAVTWEQRSTFRSNARMFFGYGRGGGQSRDPQLVARDLVRASAYIAGPLLWTYAPRWRPALAASGVLYLSLPLRRAMTGPSPLRTAAAVPIVAAVRDLSKAAGCLRGLVEGKELPG